MTKTKKHIELEAAIKALCAKCRACIGKKTYDCAEVRALLALPTIAAPGWININVALPDPDDGDWVIGVVDGKDGAVELRNAVMMVCYDSESGAWTLDHDPETEVAVRYWMPAPEAPEVPE